jgi:hypothetical protein
VVTVPVLVPLSVTLTPSKDALFSLDKIRPEMDRVWDHAVLEIQHNIIVRKMNFFINDIFR